MYKLDVYENQLWPMEGGQAQLVKEEAKKSLTRHRVCVGWEGGSPASLLAVTVQGELLSTLLSQGV